MTGCTMLPANREVKDIWEELGQRTDRVVLLASGYDPSNKLSDYKLEDGRTLVEAGYTRASLFFSELESGRYESHLQVRPAQNLRFFFEAKPWDTFSTPPDIDQALKKVGLFPDRYATVRVPKGTKMPMVGRWNGRGCVREHLHGYSYHQSGPFLNPQVRQEGWTVQSLEPQFWPHRAGKLLLPPGHYPQVLPRLQGGNDNNFMIMHGPPTWCDVCQGMKGCTIHFGTNAAQKVCQGCFRETMEQWARLLEQELPEPPKEEP